MLEQKPNFSIEEVKQILQEQYSIPNVQVSSLSSERDQNYLVDSGNKKFVLKIANFLETFDNLELQNRVINFIKDDSLFNHPILVEKNDKSIFKIEKEVKYYFVRLVTFVEGIPLSTFKPITKDFCFDYGIFLAHLTESTRHFKDFTEIFKNREFYWDCKFASNVINKYKTLIKDLNKYSLVNYYLSLFEKNKELLKSLPSSIIHNDANDYNVIIYQSKNSLQFGIIDFGDMVYSHTIINLAVGIAYLILNTQDPIQIIQHVVRGYNSVSKLNEVELQVLFVLITTRLTMSVCISAYQQTLEPQNKYLTISEEPAWKMLSKLKDANPLWIELLLRSECSYQPILSTELVKKWILNNENAIKPIITQSLTKFEIINLEVDSPLGNLNELTDQMFKAKCIESHLNNNFKTIGVVQSLTARIDYLEHAYLFQSNNRIKFKNYSSAMEIYSLENLEIFSPLDGELFKIIISAMNFFTVVLEHKTDFGAIFYSIYSNIHIENLNNVAEGLKLSKGSKIGDLIGLHNNPYPLKIQLLCLDKISLLQETYFVHDKVVVDTLFIRPEIFISTELLKKKNNNYSSEEIEEKRKQNLSGSLSVSYKKHLHIIRGSDQYLFDPNGEIYLDGVNNVAHVGHNNYSVIKALTMQANVLNTNTRYLHETIIRLAEKLSLSLPEKLHVCFFVNSGSEANELALRLAETYSKKKGIVVLNHAYHGNTSKLIEISPYKHNGPGGKGTPDFVHILDLPDPYRGKYKKSDEKAGQKYAQDAITLLDGISDIGTFIFESYPGVAGQIVLAKDYLKILLDYLKQRNIVCIADEVQIGLGRAGTNYWGFQNHTVIPDIVTVGKPFGNGHPLGAVITTKEIADSFNNGMEYFNTFGGNPVSCAVGLAVLEEIEKHNLQKNAMVVGTYLVNLLQKLKLTYDLIGDVRGTGLYIGIELIRSNETLEPADWEASYIVERLKDMGVLLSTDGVYHNVIKIKPPLVFTKENALELTNKLEIILQDTILNSKKISL